MPKRRKCICTKSNANKRPNVIRRIVIKSQPVECVEQVLPRKTIYCDDDYGYKNENRYRPMKKSDYVQTPDIYIDMDREENCITTVRRTQSRIQWSKARKGSRYHDKCLLQKEKPKRKKKIKRNKTIPSQSNFDDYDNKNKEDDSEKYYNNNECYCKTVQPKKIQPEYLPPMKPVIISDDYQECNYDYGNNEKVKEVVKTIDYDPQSEFLNRLKKGMKKAFNCKCSSCMLEKLEKSLKYTNRRALIEGAYSDVTDKVETKPRKLYAPVEKCKCNVNVCKCEVENVKKIRSDNFFQTHSTDNLIKTFKKDIPPHRCVHKFDLNERLLPKPTNLDVYGQSRCEICNKILSTTKLKTIPSKKVAIPKTDIIKKYSDKELQVPSKWSISTASKTSSLKNVTTYCPSDTYSKTKLTLTNSTALLSPGKCPNYKPCCASNLVANRPKTCVCHNRTKSPNRVTCPHNRPPSSPVRCFDCKQKPRLSSGCTKVNYDNEAIFELDLQNLEDNLMTSHKFFEKCKKVNIKPNVSPYNSLALRYQRGVF